MRPLTRENITAVLRERLLARYGTLAKAARALRMHPRDLSRVVSVSDARAIKNPNVTVPLKLLARLGYVVRFDIKRFDISNSKSVCNRSTSIFHNGCYTIEEDRDANRGRTEQAAAGIR